MNAITVLLCVALFALMIYSVGSFRKKLRYGCCGGGDAPQKTVPEDTDTAHYPYHKTLMVEGMHCAHCSARIENAFNRQAGLYARVRLDKRRAEVYGKAPLDDARLRQIVAQAGYAVRQIT